MVHEKSRFYKWIEGPKDQHDAKLNQSTDLCNHHM